MSELIIAGFIALAMLLVPIREYASDSLRDLLTVSEPVDKQERNRDEHLRRSCSFAGWSSVECIGFRGPLPAPLIEEGYEWFDNLSTTKEVRL